MIESAMGMSAAMLQQNYSYALLKRSMDDAESQAMALIESMVAATPAPAQYGVDVWA